MEPILNELSADGTLATDAEVDEAAGTFLAALAAQLRAGARPPLRVSRDSAERALSKGISVRDLLLRPALELDARRRLRSALTQGPFIDGEGGLFANAQGARAAEFTVNGLVVHGLGLAALRGHPVLSFPTPTWRALETVHVEAQYLEPPDEVVTRTERVVSLHSESAVASRAHWLRDLILPELRDGADLLARAPQLLERLAFVEAAKKQLRALNGNERVWEFVLRHLYELNRMAQGWTKDFPYADAKAALRASPESSSTRQQHGDERTFLCPDGTKRPFSWHTKVNVDNWRIYFLADAPEKPVLIGYVGEHLKIASGG